MLRQLDRGGANELLQKEVDAGWLETVPLLQAQDRWGDRLAVGRLNIVTALGKKPRLVVDSTVCGTSSCCHVGETYALPGLDCVRHCFPFRRHNGELGSFSLDIEAAHKTVRIREKAGDLLAFNISFLTASFATYILQSMSFRRCF